MRMINVPRRARERSKNGIYHIILRGNSRQEIFHDDENFIRFIANDDKCLADYIRIRLKNEEAREAIKKEMVGFNLVEIKSLPKEQRGEMLSRIKKLKELHNGKLL
jgi:REP element-mobilizing transposase RayT